MPENVNSYHVVILKLLHCKFYMSTVVAIKLLNDNKLSNIMKNKYCILRVQNYLLKIMKDVAVGILQSRNFEKKSMLRLEDSVFLKNFDFFCFFLFLIFVFLLKRSFQGILSCFEILIGSA